MSIYDLIDRRRSVRRYQETPVSSESVRRIAEAARLAPSACNNQPWHLFVVRDPETRRALFPGAGQAWIAAAPVVLVMCSRPSEAWVRRYDGKNHADIDVAIAMEHVVLAATEEGLGTCWICAFDPQLFRDVLKLPADLEPVAATPLGVPDEAPPARPRKDLEELVTWL